MSTNKIIDCSIFAYSSIFYLYAKFYLNCVSAGRSFSVLHIEQIDAIIDSLHFAHKMGGSYKRPAA